MKSFMDLSFKMLLFSGLISRKLSAASSIMSAVLPFIQLAAMAHRHHAQRNPPRNVRAAENMDRHTVDLLIRILFIIFTVFIF